MRISKQRLGTQLGQGTGNAIKHKTVGKQWLARERSLLLSEAVYYCSDEPAHGQKHQQGDNSTLAYRGEATHCQDKGVEKEIGILLKACSQFITTDIKEEITSANATDKVANNCFSSALSHTHTHTHTHTHST